MICYLTPDKPGRVQPTTLLFIVFRYFMVHLRRKKRNVLFTPAPFTTEVFSVVGTTVYRLPKLYCV
jgi:hypothetical protein